MKSYTCKRVWVAFVALVFALLGLASPALALNGHPVEGEHYKIVRGPSPKSTYLKVTPGVNLPVSTPISSGVLLMLATPFSSQTASAAGWSIKMLR